MRELGPAIVTIYTAEVHMKRAEMVVTPSWLSSRFRNQPMRLPAASASRRPDFDVMVLLVSRGRLFDFRYASSARLLRLASSALPADVACRLRTLSPTRARNRSGCDGSIDSR